jgi:hypothetical protein
VSFCGGVLCLKRKSTFTLLCEFQLTCHWAYLENFPIFDDIFLAIFYQVILTLPLIHITGTNFFDF